MSELDPAHRDLLSTRIAASGQTLVSAADTDALPEAARQRLLRMPAGTAAGLKAVA
jgi:recombinational DNA repair ATPase RecF